MVRRKTNRAQLTICSQKDTFLSWSRCAGQKPTCKWIDGLRDARGRARVLARVERLASGNPGDVRAVGEGVFELRIDHGPGYRVYFIRRGRAIVILLAGGDKGSQDRDIRLAKRLARNLQETANAQDRHKTL